MTENLLQLILNNIMIIVMFMVIIIESIHFQLAGLLTILYAEYRTEKYIIRLKVQRCIDWDGLRRVETCRSNRLKNLVR